MTINVIEDTRIRLAILGLLLEVGTVFLHSRRLLFLIGMQRSRLYLLVSVAMYTLFFLFRIPPALIGITFLLGNLSNLSWVEAGFCLPANAFFIIHSLQLLYHVVKKDIELKKLRWGWVCGVQKHGLSISNFIFIRFSWNPEYKPWVRDIFKHTLGDYIRGLIFVGYFVLVSGYQD